MKTSLRFSALIVALLLGARAASADDGNLRIAVAVDVTDAGRSFAAPTADHPIYYAPVVSGYKERGAILTYYQRGLPATYQVDSQLQKIFADQGYRLAPQPSGAAIVLDFQWGYVAPYIAPRGRRPFNRADMRPIAGQPSPRAAGLGRHGWVTNWDEIGTYIVGDKWPELAIEARRHQADPGTQEVFDSIRNAANDQTGGTLGLGARYYLLVTALDGPSFLQHRPVVLWRTHVSTPYWGHYIDEVLPTIIDSAALASGRGTQRMEVFTVPIASWGPLNGNAELTFNRAFHLSRKS